MDVVLDDEMACVEERVHVRLKEWVSDSVKLRPVKLWDTVCVTVREQLGLLRVAEAVGDLRARESICRLCASTGRLMLG